MGERGDPREWTCIVCKMTVWGERGSEPTGWCSILVNGHGGAFCGDAHAVQWFSGQSGWDDVVSRCMAQLAAAWTKGDPGMTVEHCQCCGASTGKASDVGLCPTCDGYLEVVTETLSAQLAAVQAALQPFRDMWTFDDEQGMCLFKGSHDCPALAPWLQQGSPDHSPTCPFTVLLAVSGHGEGGVGNE